MDRTTAPQEKIYHFSWWQNNIPLDHNASLSTDFGTFRQSALIGWARADLLNIADVHSPSSPPIFACCCVFAVQCTRVPPPPTPRWPRAQEKRCVCPCDYKVNGLGAVFIFKEKKKVCVVVPYIDWAMQYFFLTFWLLGQVSPAFANPSVCGVL